MFSKIAIIILYFSYSCLGQNTIYPDSVPAETTLYKEDGTTIDPIAILEELRITRYGIQNKQLQPNAPAAVNNVTAAGSTLSNVTNAVSTTVSNVYNRIPCACFKGQCGCCTGPLLQSFNQKACLNVTYEPEEFAFNAALSFNDRVLYKNRISGKNPPPICVRVPRIPIIRVCARFTNVYFTGANMHACIGMGANFDDFTLFDTVLNCFRIGAGGVALVPPEDGGGIGIGGIDEDDDDDDDDDDYDDSARGFMEQSFLNRLE